MHVQAPYSNKFMKEGDVVWQAQPTREMARDACPTP
jgi:hypothetical protein